MTPPRGSPPYTSVHECYTALRSKYFPRHTLVRHLTVLLLVKFVLLYGLWAVFFSSPAHVDAQQISTSFTGVSPKETVP